MEIREQELSEGIPHCQFTEEQIRHCQEMIDYYDNLTEIPENPIDPNNLETYTRKLNKLNERQTT